MLSEEMEELLMKWYNTGYVRLAKMDFTPALLWRKKSETDSAVDRRQKQATK